MTPFSMPPSSITRLLRRSTVWSLLLAGGLVGATPTESQAANSKSNVQFLWKGARVEGRVLVRSQADLLVLGRDGKVWNVDADRVQRSSAAAFRSYTPSVMRNLLLKEFGPGFDVTATGTYLVVHPIGQRDQWAARFDQLYHSMVHYFLIRGIKVHKPEFPMVAIVLPTRAAFVKYCRENDGPRSASVLGYYHSFTNRIALYDVTAGRPQSKDWRINAATLVHEAAHQTAYNTGIHARFAPPPRWVAEGLGTMFEARGIYDARRYRKLQDRINPEQLNAFRRHFPKTIPQGTLARLVVSDTSFQQNWSANYALSWALTFMMSEQEPRRLSHYLQKTAARRDFTAYSSAQKLRDFQASFGKNSKMLEARLWRFTMALK